ncbi:protein TonB [Povalibacter uvarum]|uniref:Protein TonB n=1 Tax=Povalibacter uvarum TaxID=732238 RepID=A0A841HP22_9GAMM|nr:energy transducer TonB [Povalibacter uvarum]MBB6094384.1 protein TonB [Povalibacter uvarum]
MSHRVVEAVLGPIETRIIEEAPKPEDKPPPPPPKIETPPPFVPPPEVAIEIPMDAAPTTAIRQTTQQAPVAQPPPAPVAAPVARTAPKSDARRPLTQPEYPPSSRRAGETGTVILEVYVLENGRAGDVRVKTSSGFPKLDEAAVREVKRSWRLVPGTENGKPVPMWGQFAVTFKLTD